MTDNSTVQDLVTAISEGRACLLLGQDHTEGLVGSVTTEASSLASTPVASLKEALGRLDQLRSCRFLKVATHPSSDSASARPCRPSRVCAYAGCVNTLTQLSKKSVTVQNGVMMKRHTGIGVMVMVLMRRWW